MTKSQTTFTKKFEVPAGSEGTTKFPFTLDDDYRNVVGMRIFPSNTNTGDLADDWEVSFQDQNNVYEDMVPYPEYVPQGVNPDEAYKTVDIENKKQQFYLVVNIPEGETVAAGKKLTFTLALKMINPV